ncbi:MAG: carboxypeptidase-like regulatory domain-containing protein [Lachnospiraceae bacterium]|nr:carboxypeptidase-like regulatory domain-containing protein [Lachnospiraceae bacterium]
MKSKIPFLFHSLLFLCLSIITFIWCMMIFPLHGSAKTAKPKWKKEISSLEIGKIYRYRIKHCPKNTKVQFTSNHASRASINRKTGLLLAKKKGSVNITAIIRQPHKKAKRLKTKLQITKKKATETSQKPAGLSANTAKNNPSILSHVRFSVAKSINPWNHSIMLYSSRILLLSEIQNTELTLSPLATKSNANADPTLTAQFSSLSADGKTITYQLSGDSAKRLCPGNGTFDGEYHITSTFFPDTLQTQYQERIQLNCISGFVLDTNQLSLSQVSVRLYADSQNVPLAVTTTDKNGYYQFKNITEKNIRIEATLENYETYSQPSLHPVGQNICQNIILHPSSTNNLAVSCQILDEQNRPIKNTTVILTTKTTNSSAALTNQENDPSDHFFLQGMADNNGMISFANQKSISSNGYTQIAYYANQSTPRFISAGMPTSDSVICNSLQPFTRNQEYTLYVFPATDGTTIPMDYQMESFSFSFTHLLSDQLFLQIQLQKLPLLSAEKVSISTDTIKNSNSSYHYRLYDRTGKELFQTIFSPLPENSENDYSKQLTMALQCQNVRLPDGDYYAAVTAYDNISSSGQASSNMEHPYTDQICPNIKNFSSGTTILPVQICNNVITSTHFTLSPCQTFRSLVYTDCENENLEMISFILYQKTDTIHIPIGTYTTDHFSPIHTGQKAYLNLPVLTDSSYVLVPTNTRYKITAGASFQVSAEENKRISSDTPEHQILFDKIPDNEYTIESELDLSHLLDYTDYCTNKNFFSSDYFFHSATYPNTVYAYYQTNGTFTNLFFATPAFSSLENPSPNLICNQLQNGMMIHTSQESYSTTPFFVT